MILLIDVGNTNTVIGGYHEGEYLFVSRLSSDHTRTMDEYAVLLSSIIEMRGGTMHRLEGAAISSVVPSLKNTYADAVRLIADVPVLVVEPGVKTGHNIKIDNPGQLGSDLLCGCVAATALYGTPCIIIDLGTATTITAVGEDGSLLGGSIIPGIRISLEALSTRTAQLPHIALSGEPTLIGRNSVDSMLSGVVLGNASMIDGMIDRYRAVLGPDMKAVATGGLSKYIVPHCTHDVIVNEELILHGLRLLYEKNHK